MAGVAGMMEVLAKRIFDISFDDYVGTVNGIFNIIEVIGGAAVYMMTGTTETSTQGCLQGSAFSFCFNGVFMIVSSFLSGSSGYQLSGLFYYVVFNGTAALMYLIPSVMILKEANEAGMSTMMGLATGSVHAIHCTYSTYEIYWS
ncbi:hypothetical protein MTO96_028159 [Rhipicephalus appendiculatus]